MNRNEWFKREVNRYYYKKYWFREWKHKMKARFKKWKEKV